VGLFGNLFGGFQEEPMNTFAIHQAVLLLANASRKRKVSYDLRDAKFYKKCISYNVMHLLMHLLKGLHLNICRQKLNSKEKSIFWGCV